MNIDQTTSLIGFLQRVFAAGRVSLGGRVQRNRVDQDQVSGPSY